MLNNKRIYDINSKSIILSVAGQHTFIVSFIIHCISYKLVDCRLLIIITIIIISNLHKKGYPGIHRGLIEIIRHCSCWKIYKSNTLWIGNRLLRRNWRKYQVWTLKHMESTGTYLPKRWLLQTDSELWILYT